MLEAKTISSEIRKRAKPPLLASFEQYCKSLINNNKINNKFLKIRLGNNNFYTVIRYRKNG